MPSIFKPDWLPKGPAEIQHTEPSEPVKALQIEDVERVVHESIFHPMKALEDVIKTLEIQNRLLQEVINDNLIKRQYHDDFAQLGLTLNYRFVYHRHTYVYLYSATAFTLLVSDGSSQAIPANYYTLLNYPEGVYMTVSGGSDTAPILCRFRSCDVPLEPGTQQMTLTNTSIAVTQSGLWSVSTNVSSTGTGSSVAANAASVTLLAANTNRKGATFVNEGTANLFLAQFTPASLTSYTAKIGPGVLYELYPQDYQGIVTGIWDVANGNCRITENT